MPLLHFQPPTSGNLAPYSNTTFVSPQTCTVSRLHLAWLYGGDGIGPCPKHVGKQ